ncbi:hypothetical protein [Rhizobium sp. J15]|uniref:hypothetical protein n=1 Tax=Rhizobium sp. J15 TaxID=2035450 RepID=UPI001143E7AE|nr:hypothetical protein [Rhizobium sp. J15]
MPRNGSGVASQPANTRGGPSGTSISSSKYNTVTDDIYQLLNDPMPITSGGTNANTIAGARTNLELDKKVVYVEKSADYTAVAADNNAVHRYTAAATVTIDPAATLATNWHHTIIADANVRIDPDGAELINGASFLSLVSGQAAYVICSGTAFHAIVVNRYAPAVPGQIYGLTLSNNVADATNDIDIAAGSAASDGATPYLMTLGSALTKRLDAGWSVGTNQGGLDTGSVANGTYNVFEIQRSDTGVVDALFSLSATAPTMPANYDRKRILGSILRESGAIVAFTQVGDIFKRKLPVRDVNATSAGISAVTRTLSIPTGRVLEALLSVQVATSGASGESAYISELTSPDQAVSSPYITVGLGAGGAGQEWVSGRWFTNASAQIRSRQSVGGATETLNIFTLGWVDTRGREG